ARTQRPHGAGGRASTRRPAAPQRRTVVLGQHRRYAMSTTTVRTQLVLVLALLVFAMFAATSSAFACVVGTGTSASCTEAALNACLPGGGSFDGTVTFACGGAATITVTSTKTISANTTIDGGSVITISGGGTVGVFFVYGPVFAVQNLTIANGKAGFPSYAGGAIFIQFATLTVTNCPFSDNSATGSFAVMEAADGGAIVNINNNVGALTVTDSTFSGNSANRFGGAIANSASTGIVTNCSFSGNSAGTAGGAISNSSGTVTVTNSTFSGNSAAAGGGAIGSDNCVLQVPGGGTVTVVNSILANSTLGGNCGVSNSEFPCT